MWKKNLQINCNARPEVINGNLPLTRASPPIHTEAQKMRTQLHAQKALNTPSAFCSLLHFFSFIQRKKIHQSCHPCRYSKRAARSTALHSSGQAAGAGPAQLRAFCPEGRRDVRCKWHTTQSTKPGPQRAGRPPPSYLKRERAQRGPPERAAFP